MKIKTILTTIALAYTCNATALDISKLDAAQLEQLQTQIAALKQKAEDGPALDSAKNWARYGLDITRGISRAAVEAGMTVPEFTNTTTGKMAMFAAMWQVMGHEVIRVAFGFLLALMGIVLSIWLIRTHRYMYEAEYKTEPLFFGLVDKQTLVSFKRDEDIGFRSFMSVVISALSIFFGYLISQ